MAERRNRNDGCKICSKDHVRWGSDAATINEKAAEYATPSEQCNSAARRGYVDTIIEPEDTRKYVIGAFEMLHIPKRRQTGQKTRNSLRKVAYDEKELEKN